MTEKLYYGWIIVIACNLVACITWDVTIFNQGVFAAYWIREFGWSPATLALAPTLDIIILSRTLSEVPDRGWTPFLRELWATLRSGAVVFVKDEQAVEDEAVDLLGADAWSVPGVRGVFLRHN